MKPRQLVLIGGGHAHMVMLANLKKLVKRGVRVTVIQPSEYHYYSGMGPGMLGGSYLPNQIRFATRRIVEGQGGCFIRAKAASINSRRQVVALEEGKGEVPYDVLSCNAGSYVPKKKIVHGDNVFAAKPIEGLLVAQQRVIRESRRRQIDVAVIGGGPSSVEIAGNVWQLGQRSGGFSPRIRLFAGHRLLARMPERLGTLARETLSGRGIEIIEKVYVKTIAQGQVELEDNRSFPADVFFAAVGVKPSPIFSRSDLPTGPDGGLLVNTYLQSTACANIFGGGDCICFQPQPLNKVGVYAVRENPVLFHNVQAALFGGALQPFHPGGAYLLIYNLGGGTGLLSKRSLVFRGRPAFWVKDWIDRRFIRKFQALERTM